MARHHRAGETPFIIKVCGVTQEEDVESAVEAGANAIGFNFYDKSPRYVTPARARQLERSVQGNYLRVGVFVNPSEEELLETASAIPLDVLQMHGDSVPLHLASSFRVWRVGHAETPRASLDPAVEAWLLDTPTPQFGGSGKTFDWRLAADFPQRMIVAGGLSADNVAAAISAAKPWGVDACSRLESAPGKKDPVLVRAFVENARAAFAAHQPLQ